MTSYSLTMLIVVSIFCICRLYQFLLTTRNSLFAQKLTFVFTSYYMSISFCIFSFFHWCFYFTVPSQPQYIAVISASATEIGLSWSEPEVPNGKIKQYHIQIFDHERSILAADVTYNVTNEYDDKLSTVIEKLTPATDYFIKVSNVY